MKEETENEADSFWAKGSFSETVSSEELKEKIKTLHKKSNEDMDFSCRKCNRKISAHNKDWHAGMCDDCFHKEYFEKD